MNARDQIKTIIGDQLGVGVDELDDDVHFRDLPNVSSMKVLQIILETEKRFGIEVDDDLTFRVQTIGQYCNEVDTMLASRITASGQA